MVGRTPLDYTPVTIAPIRGAIVGIAAPVELAKSADMRCTGTLTLSSMRASSWRERTLGVDVGICCGCGVLLLPGTRVPVYD